MGKNKKGVKVFKVAGAKSLKKRKSKQVKLGLKNIKYKVDQIDKQFLNLQKNPQPKKIVETVKLPEKTIKDKSKIKKDTVEALEKLDKMEM